MICSRQWCSPTSSIRHAIFTLFKILLIISTAFANFDDSVRLISQSQQCKFSVFRWYLNWCWCELRNGRGRWRDEIWPRRSVLKWRSWNDGLFRDSPCDAASDQGEVAIPPTLITPAAVPVAEPVGDAASGRGELEIPLPSAMPPKPLITDESWVSIHQFASSPRFLTGK